MASCFVYGTLQFPEVLQALIKRVPRSQPATVSGYRRYALQGQVFPATVPASPDSQVQGLVLFDLTPQELHVFDEFEGEEYYKARVQPALADGSSVVADIYLWQDRLRPLCYGSWSEEEFRERHLASYTEMCGTFAAELAAGLG